MKSRPKDMPRWAWKEKLEKDKDLQNTSTIKTPEESNILGIIVVTLIIGLIVWAILTSMSGPPDNTCGSGYHWEEDSRGINGGCAPN